MTFNEAWTATKLASGSGKAPGIKPFMDPTLDPYIAGHNILNAHAAAVDIYRRKYKPSQGGIIGITNNQDWREPKTDGAQDIAAAERAILFQLGWFSEPIFGQHGDYPPEMRSVFGDRLPEFTDVSGLPGEAFTCHFNHKNLALSGPCSHCSLLNLNTIGPYLAGASMEMCEYIT